MDPTPVPIVITAYTDVVDSMVSTLGGSVPSILTAVAVVGLGIFAFSLGWRLIRRVAS